MDRRQGLAKGRAAIQKLMDTTIGTSTGSHGVTGTRGSNFHVFTPLKTMSDEARASRAVILLHYLLIRTAGQPHPGPRTEDGPRTKNEEPRTATAAAALARPAVPGVDRRSSTCTAVA
jgi:hypothetical protein